MKRLRGGRFCREVSQGKFDEEWIPINDLLCEKTNNIYQLIAVSLDTRAWGDRRIHKQKDGSILTYEQHLGIFTTVEKAERMIRGYLAHLSESDVLLGFFLYERPLDERYETAKEVCLGGHKSVRSYFADGTLNCFSDLDTECVKLFTGRDPSTLKVKKGDYAYAYQRDRVVPMLVGALPPDRKWFERQKRKDPSFAGSDYSDDSYWGLGIDGHFHPFAADVFPAFCPINKAVKKKLDYSYRVETVPGEYEKWCKRNRHKWQKRKAGRF